MDHFPELVGSLGLVRMITSIVHREFRSEEKVTDRVLVEYTVNQDPLRMFFKVDPVIAAAVSMKRAAVPTDRSEIGTLQRIKVGWKDLELGKQIELEILGERAHFCGTDGIEDDLEHGGKW